MARPSAPWYKKSHKAWYTKIDGKLVRLAATKAEATRVFHHLMARRGGGEPLPATVPFERVIDLWFGSLPDTLAVKTFARYQEYGQSLIDFAGKTPVADIRPSLIARWLNAHPAWKSPATRHLAVSVAKLITAWATEDGILGRDPFARVRRPPMRRRPPTRTEDVGKLTGGIRSPEFADFLAVAVETGCRPGELRTLEASRIDWDAATAIVRGKRGERTVHLSPGALKVLRRWADRFPTGPVLRNTRGEPWGEKAIQCQFSRCGARAGVKVVPYQTRGLFASEAIRRGESPLVVSKLLGHRNSSVLEQHYAHIDDDQLREAVNRAAGSGPAAHPPARPGRPPGKKPGTP